MATEESFSSAFIDGARSTEYARITVLGVRVRKFCLWHRLMLKAAGSPLVNNGKVTMRDLRIAVGICRCGFGDSMVRKPWFIPTIIWCVSFVLSLWPFRAKLYEGWIVKHTGKFFTYAGDYLQQPDYTVVPPDNHGKKPPRTLPAPEEMEHAAELIKWSGWSEDVIWNMPLGKANWYRVMAMRDAGMAIDFNNDQERQFTAQLPKEYKRNG